VNDNDGLGGKFWLGIVGAIIGCTVAAILIFFIVSSAWFKWGFIGMFVFFSLILLAVGAIYDRKHKRDWEEE
jgi:hypothetical protein